VPKKRAHILSAKIVSVSDSGQMHIEFSHKLVLKDSNLINSTAIDIYIEPYQDLPPEEMRDHFNLTWAVESYDRQNLYLQLEFKDPLSIS